MTRLTTLLFFLAGLFVVGAGVATAAPLLMPATYTDTAANTVYSDGWQNGDDDSPIGTGFGAWQLTASTANTSQAGFFVGNSNGNGDGGTFGINTGGRAWGMYANSSQTTTATRSMSIALSAGDTLTVRMDNGFIANGSQIRVELLNNAGTVLSTTRFVGGGSAYQVVDTSGTTNTGIGYTDEGLTLGYQIGTLGTYTATILANEGGTFQQANRLLNVAVDRSVRQIRLVNANAGTGGGADAFFNNLSVTYASLAVTLGTFEAMPDPNGVRVAWETVSEVDALGFNLYRATTPDATLDLLNGELIPAQAPGGSGASYEYLDTTATTGTTYYYYLDAVDINGEATRYGPVSVELTPTAVTLDTLTATANPTWLPFAFAVAGLVALTALWQVRRG